MRDLPSLRRMSFTLIVCLIAASLAGCSSSDPSGPDTIVEDLFIGGVYFYYPDGGAPRSMTGAYVIIRDGSQTGAVVDGLTVKVNDYQLTFDQSIGYYTGVAPSLSSGDDVTIRVSDGLGSVSQTVQVPYASTNLMLDDGVWDTSSSMVSNTLRWSNPVITAQAIGVFIYDQIGNSTTRVWGGGNDNAGATSLTIWNYALSYYDMTSVLAIVGQVNYAYFPNNPDQSAIVVLAGDGAVWPVSD